MMGSGIKGPCLNCPDRNAKRRTSLERRRRK